MTWETKLGLLVGMGVIILIGILISDHLSQAQRQQQARLERTLPELEQSPLPPPIDPQNRETGSATADASGRSNPLPPAEGQADDSAPAQAAADKPEPAEPDTIRQHIQPERAFSTGATDEPTDRSNNSEPTDTSDMGRTDQSLPEGFVRVDGPGQQPASQTEPSSDSGSGNETSGGSSSQGGDASESDELVHHVNKGETLSDIARQYYDDPSYWKSIFEANRSRIPSPGKVQPGVRLVIPNKAGRANTPGDSQASGDSNDNSGSGTRTYEVQPGDSLSTIAERFFGSPAAWRDLYKLNKDRIDDPDSLKPGTKLRIPSRLTGSEPDRSQSNGNDTQQSAA